MTTFEDDKNSDGQVYESTEDLEIEQDSSRTSSSENIDDSCFGKTKRIGRTIYKGARSLVGLVVILLLYSLLGAFVFMTIESQHEQEHKKNIIEVRNELIEDLEDRYKQFRNISDWILAIENSLKTYEDAIREALENNVATNSTEEVWTIWSGIFFVFTVYTTIGYGNLAPVTGFGRVVCIIYAGIGIPLALLLFAELGKQFTVALKFLWAFVRRSYYTGYLRRIREKIPFKQKYQLNEDPAALEAKTDEERSRSGSRMVYGYEVDSEFNLPLSVAIAIMFFYILIGAIMYMFWEDWGFIESIYFVFISLSTIGFGDVHPAHQKFFVISSTYVFIGLSLVSMCINVAIDFFNSAANRAKQKMGQAKKKIGVKVNKAHQNAKEKATAIKTNIADGKTKLKQKTDEKITNLKMLKTNIVDETAKLKQKTDEKISGLKSNINEETTKFRKKADEKFRRKSSPGRSLTNSKGELEQIEANNSLKVPNDDGYEVIGKMNLQSMEENKL
ncbi:hypothetical protein ACF0H5_008870 [Mactra antiquata]